MILVSIIIHRNSISISITCIRKIVLNSEAFAEFMHKFMIILVEA